MADATKSRKRPSTANVKRLLNIYIANACVSDTMQTQRLSHAAVLLAVLLTATAYASCILQLA